MYKGLFLEAYFCEGYFFEAFLCQGIFSEASKKYSLRNKSRLEHLEKKNEIHYNS